VFTALDNENLKQDILS